MVKLEGKVKKFVFEAKDSPYKVLLIESNKKEVIAFGNFFTVAEGEEYLFYGEFIKHAKYGEQFKVNKYERNIKSETGLITFLSGPKFVGVGKNSATKIVKKLGLDAINLINQDPDILDTIEGLKKSQKEIIVEEIKTINQEDKIYLELYNYGLTPKASLKLYDKYGPNTINKIKDNPYCLIYEVDGFGFKKADSLALTLGFKEDSPIRIREAILYILINSCYKDGNIYLLYNDFLKEINQYLGIDINKIEEQINELATNNRLKLLNERVYPNNLYNAEFKVSEYLKRIIKAKPNNLYQENKILSIINKIEEKNKFAYTQLQKETLLKVLNNKVSIITGGPGTGKTTIVKGIINIYQELNKKRNDDILLLAPTGRAAKRLKESTKLGAYTIHRGLGYDYEGNFNYNELNYLPYNLIIIDEASMIDIELAMHLLEAVNVFSQVVFIGDENQLPSVGPGDFLHDLISSSMIPTYRLKEVMRQVSDSNIIKLSNMVLNRKIDSKIFNEKKEVFYYQCDKTNVLLKLKKILDNYIEKGNDFNNLQILIPIYSGVGGIDEVNQYVQSNYNLIKDPFLKHKDLTFYPHDKVLELQNTPEKDIMNGDVGYVVDIFNDSLGINFNGKIVRLEKNDLDNLTLAYALSVHKSQGSEYDFVIFLVLSSYSIMLKRKLIYTAITRAKKKLIILGDLNLLQNKIKYDEKTRNTSLGEFLVRSKEVSPYDFL